MSGTSRPKPSGVKPTREQQATPKRETALGDNVKEPAASNATKREPNFESSVADDGSQRPLKVTKHEPRAAGQEASGKIVAQQNKKKKSWELFDVHNDTAFARLRSKYQTQMLLVRKPPESEDRQPNAQKDRLPIHTPPAVVASQPTLAGLGLRPKKQEVPSDDQNKYFIELLFGKSTLPKSVRKRFPNIVQEHESFLERVSEILKMVRDRTFDMPELVPQEYKRSVRNKASNMMQNLDESQRTQLLKDLIFSRDGLPRLTEDKKGRPMMKMRLQPRAIVDKQAAASRPAGQPVSSFDLSLAGAAGGSEASQMSQRLRDFYDFVGPSGPKSRRQVQVFAPSGERILESEMTRDPFYEPVKAGDMVSVDIDFVAYSDIANNPKGSVGYKIGANVMRFVLHARAEQVHSDKVLSEHGTESFQFTDYGLETLGQGGNDEDDDDFKTFGD